MSKKVLVLSGSPRKSGNSDLLCDEFLKGEIKATKYLQEAYEMGKSIN